MDVCLAKASRALFVKSYSNQTKLYTQGTRQFETQSVGLCDGIQIKRRGKYYVQLSFIFYIEIKLQN